MKLKRLSLQGYKTFATKTEFFFDDGITAIVGPNGSGKSNVADAVRWVLGEQSFSTLRGKRTVDMIFAGSKNRPRAGMAQATLTLDNSDGWLPIDYTEVEICRRAYRSGDNEYLLNGQRVRLKDIGDLLARAGLAEQTYTIIGQGLIDQALSLKADERRALFEEAAGISHYKAKRATSLRKLQDTQHNLARVYDILSELRPRLNSLRRQAERARTYAQLEVDLHDMLRIWYGYQWEAAKKALRERRAASDEAEASWQEARSRLLELQDKIEEARSQIHDLDGQQQALEREREQIREEWEQARREIAILRERRSALERQLSETGEDIPLLESQKERAAAELHGATAELQTAQSDLARRQKEVQAYETDFAQTQQAIDEARRKVAALEKRQREGQTGIAQAEGRISQLRERLRERQPAETGEAAAAGSDEQLAALETAVAAARAAADNLAARRHTLQEERRALEKEIGQARTALEQSRRSFSAAQTAVARQQTRVDMLDQLRHKEAPQLAGVEILGRLAQLLTIPPPWQKALELALQERLAALILPDEGSFWQLFDGRSPDQQLSALVAGRLQSRPVDEETAQLLQQTAGAALAAAVVDCPPPFKPLIDGLLGRTLLVPDGRTAARLALQLPADFLVVSQDGLLAHASGLLELPRADGRNSLLAQEEAWRTAQVELEREKEGLDGREAEAGERQAALETLLARLEEIDQARRRLGREGDEGQQQLNRAQRELDRFTQQRTFVAQQEARERQEIERLEQGLARLESEIERETAELAEVETGLADARAALAALPVGEAAQQRQSLQQQVTAVRAIVDSRRAIADSRRATLTQLEQQIGRLQARRQDWSTQLLGMDLAEQEAALKGLQERLGEIDAELNPLRTALRERSNERRQLESAAAGAQKITHDRESRFTQARVALAQQETHIDNLKDRIRQDLGLVALSYDEDQIGESPLPLNEVIEQLPLVPELPEDLEESIQKARGQISRIGAVNPEAPQEFEEVEERFNFLTQQVEDLEKTEIHLRQVIAELDDLTSRAFADTVERVNEIFGKMFTRLFGGGSAQLLLTDPDDLTITGVDIIAQLPGRRPQGLALLSGGERSLTASSLIFALLKVSPTPFCVMDEVDAALDEANVNRFREVLRELSEKTQFIVITHNRGTVQAAQTIYGITMGTDSTSQVISVKPEEYVRQAELLH